MKNGITVLMVLGSKPDETWTEARLAKETGLSVQEVFEALSWLQENDYVKNLGDKQ